MPQLYSTTEDGKVQFTYQAITFDPDVQKIQQLRELIKQDLNLPDDNFTIFDMGVQRLIIHDDSIASARLKSQDLALKYLLILNGVNQRPPKPLVFVDGDEPKELQPTEQRMKLMELLNLNISDYGYKKYNLDTKTSQTNYTCPFDKLPWPGAGQEMTQFIANFVEEKANPEFKVPVKELRDRFERTVSNESSLYLMFDTIVNATIVQVMDSSRFEFMSQESIAGGTVDFVLMDKVTKKAIASLEIKTHRDRLSRQITENRENQLTRYLLKVDFGVLTTIHQTLVVEKCQELRNGKPYTYVKISQPFGADEFVKAVSFICLKAIRKSMLQSPTTSSKLPPPLNDRNTRRDQEDEDSDSDSDDQDYDESNAFQDPPSSNTRFKTKMNSRYNSAVDILHNQEVLASLLSSFATLKVTLDYEDEENTESRPYAEGASGVIFLGYVSMSHTDNQVRCAAKIGEIDKLKPGAVYDLCQEARILSYLNMCGVSCVPKLLYSGFLTSTAFFAVVTEFIENARHYNLDTLKPRRAALFANAINQLHTLGVNHGDLDSSNVLFQRLSNGQERCVIIDFAFSTLLVNPSPFTTLSPVSLKNRHIEYQDNIRPIERQRRADKAPLKKLYSSFVDWFNKQNSGANSSLESLDTSC